MEELKTLVCGKEQMVITTLHSIPHNDNFRWLTALAELGYMNWWNALSGMKMGTEVFVKPFLNWVLSWIAKVIE